MAIGFIGWTFLGLGTISLLAGIAIQAAPEALVGHGCSGGLGSCYDAIAAVRTAGTLILVGIVGMALGGLLVALRSHEKTKMRMAASMQAPPQPMLVYAPLPPAAAQIPMPIPLPFPQPPLPPPLGPANGPMAQTPPPMQSTPPKPATRPPPEPPAVMNRSAPPPGQSPPRRRPPPRPEFCPRCGLKVGAPICPRCKSKLW
jgi:hypothetical protein